MKKTCLLLIAGAFFNGTVLLASIAEPKTYQGKGEVRVVSPVFSRISIKHEAIKGFSEAGETEFTVTSRDLLANLSRADAVDFEVVDISGDVKIRKITKTGIVPPADNRLPVGKAVQEVLEGTSQVVSGVTQPIEPANQVASGVMGATTNATGAVLDEASPDVKKDF